MKVFTQLAQLVWALPKPAAIGPATALEPAITAATAARPLKGRFVHLTDLHPDPFYRTGGAESEACHFKKRKKKKRHRGKSGSVERGQEGELVDDEHGDDLDDNDEEEEEDGEGVSIARKGKGKGKRKKKKRRKARRAGHWGLPVRCASCEETGPKHAGVLTVNVSAPKTRQRLRLSAHAGERDV